jgi:hypothetical protein
MPKNVEEVHVGVGGLYVAAVGTALPADLADPIAPWVHVGYTDGGFQFTYGIEELKVPADQSLEPIKIVTTGRTITIATTLLQISADNLVLAYGGGTITPESGYDLYTPPAIGEEEEVSLYFKLVNEVDGPVRLAIRRAKRTGDSAIAFTKTEAAKISASWEVLDPGMSADPTPVQLEAVEYRIVTPV